MRTIILLLLTPILFSCGSSGSRDENKTEPHTLETFWIQFTEAVKNNDRSKLAILCEFPMGGTLDDTDKRITQDQFFEDYYSSFFQEAEWRNLLLASTVNDLVEERGGVALYLVISDEFEGETYESGWVLYFREREDGWYRLAAMSFAG